MYVPPMSIVLHIRTSNLKPFLYVIAHNFNLPDIDWGTLTGNTTALNEFYNIVLNL